MLEQSFWNKPMKINVYTHYEKMKNEKKCKMLQKNFPHWKVGSVDSKYFQWGNFFWRHITFFNTHTQQNVMLWQKIQMTIYGSKSVKLLHACSQVSKIINTNCHWNMTLFSCLFFRSRYLWQTVTNWYSSRGRHPTWAASNPMSSTRRRVVLSQFMFK